MKLHYYAGKAALGSRYIFHYHNSIFVLLHMYLYLVWCFSGGEVTNVWNIFCLASKLLSELPLDSEVVAGSSDPLEVVEDNPSAKEKFLYTFLSPHHEKSLTILAQFNTSTNAITILVL